MKNLLFFVLCIELVSCQKVDSQNQTQGHSQHGTAATAAQNMQESKKQKWHCPMHPQIIRDQNEPCPLCGMDLVPIEEHEEHNHEGVSSGKNHPIINLSPAVIQKTGVKITHVSKGVLNTQIRGFGNVQMDETQIQVVSAWVKGFIKNLRASTPQMHIQKGQELLRIFSPEWNASQSEYLLALQNPDAKLKEQLAKAALSKLQSQGFPPRAIERLKSTKTIQQEVSLDAPTGGILMEKNVYLGQSVEMGMPLFKIANLSQVWVEAEFPQGTQSQIKIGQTANLQFDAYPGQSWTATVKDLLPTLNPNTKAVRVRLVLANSLYKLKIGQNTQVQLQSSEHKSKIIIPEQAIIPTGNKMIVIRSLGAGKFQAKEIQTGQRANEQVEVINGLEEGDAIVHSAQFLIDSESNIRAAVEAMNSK